MSVSASASNLAHPRPTFPALCILPVFLQSRAYPAFYMHTRLYGEPCITHVLTEKIEWPLPKTNKNLEKIELEKHPDQFILKFPS